MTHAEFTDWGYLFFMVIISLYFISMIVSSLRTMMEEIQDKHRIVFLGVFLLSFMGLCFSFSSARATATQLFSNDFHFILRLAGWI